MEPGESTGIHIDDALCISTLSFSHSFIAQVTNMQIFRNLSDNENSEETDQLYSSEKGQKLYISRNSFLFQQSTDERIEVKICRERRVQLTFIKNKKIQLTLAGRGS